MTPPTELITGDAFDDLFTSFSFTADRLEIRDRYRSEVEDKVVQRFVARKEDDLSWSRAWFGKIRKMTAEGRRFRRVRVVSVPLTDYQRCGVLRVSPHNIAAGESIRYLDRADAVGLPGLDYWLFDVGTPAARAVKLHFDAADQLLGGESITDGVVIGELSAAFGRAFEAALPPERFAEVHGLR